MIRKTLAALAVLGLFASPALAAHCPMDAAAIDNALEARSELPEEQRSEVMALRDRGMELHNAGNHREAEATLAEGMRILLNAE